VERETDVDMEDLEESNMDLEGLLSLRNEDNNSTEKVSNSSSELEKSEVKSGRGVVVVVT
jgi:hypothetical protein